MTGLEPIVATGLASAAKALPAAVSKIATSIGLKLAKSWTLRWRLARRVKKETGISFSSKLYRSWLKASAEKNLHKSVSDVGPNLAVSLDEKLSADESWCRLKDRHSAALAIVKSTYSSAVALAEPREAQLLHETWAQSRHDELIVHLGQITTGRSFLNRPDRASLLLAESVARRRRRLSALGILEDRVASALSLLESNIPVIGPGQFTIIAGSFGSGKSELAETWLRQRITDYKDGASLAVPVWLHASDLLHRTLEESLSHHVKSDEPCAIVVDGLDEVEGQAAARIVERVGVFVETNNQSVALLTSRHGVLPESREQQNWDGISTDQARDLIESVSEMRYATWNWNPLLVESVRRPFFAIGAGVLIAEGERAFSQADLVRRLVELALKQPKSAVLSVQNSELYNLLKKAALNLVSSGGVTDGLTFQERQQIRTTRLVAGSERNIEFTLPIFQQWFAAQDLLSNEELLRKAASSPESFDRWRWSLSIAGLTAQTADEYDAFAGVLMQTNPGAAAWVFDQISSARGWPSRNPNEFVDASTAGDRMLVATRTWIDAMGALGPLLFPITYEEQPISLRITVKEGVIGTVWDRHVPAADTVSTLEENFDWEKSDTWLYYSSAGVVNGLEWPWARLQKDISKGMAKALSSTYRLGPVGGVWHNESRYRLARAIAHEQTAYFKPLKRSLVASRIANVLNGVPNPEQATFKFNNVEANYHDLIDLSEWIESLDEPRIVRPLPAPDQEFQTGWVWSAYSDDGLIGFIAETYGLACVAYDEARLTAFADFDWSMGTGMPGEFGVVAIVDLPDANKGRESGPGLTMSVVPISVIKTEMSRFGASARRSNNGRALVVERSKCGLSDGHEAEFNYFMGLAEGLPHGDRSPFGRRSMVNRVVDFTSNSRPATEIAIDWLWKDLESLKIAEGSGPRLR